MRDSPQLQVRVGASALRRGPRTVNCCESPFHSLTRKKAKEERTLVQTPDYVTRPPGSIHRAPLKERLRDRLDSIVRVLFQSIGLIAGRLESDVYFDVRTIDVHRGPLEAIR